MDIGTTTVGLRIGEREIRLNSVCKRKSGNL